MVMSSKTTPTRSAFVSPQRPRRVGAMPDYRAYWAELAAALGLPAADAMRLRSERSLVRAGVVFRIVADDEAADPSRDGLMPARLTVSLPLLVDAMDRGHLLRLLQTHALMAQTVGLVVAAGPMGELNLVATLSVQRPQEMARWIDAAAWLAQSIVGDASASAADDQLGESKT
jgi:hypothetical protein